MLLSVENTLPCWVYADGDKADHVCCINDETGSYEVEILDSSGCIQLDPSNRNNILTEWRQAERMIELEFIHDGCREIAWSADE